MSLASVRPFYRGRIKGLGYTEHKDFTNISNIPSTVIDRSFHLESGEIVPSSGNQLSYTINYPIVIRIFRKGFKNPHELNNELDSDIDIILADLLAPSVKNTTTIKDVVVSGVRRIELDVSNDNAIILEISCNTKIICAYA